MKILVTGSHFTPAQATIEELQKNKDIKIVYLGRKYTREGDKTPSVESRVLPKLGVKFIPVIAGRLQRSFTIYTIPSLLKIPFGFLQAFYLLLREQPDVVLSFGGYVAVPTVISAWLLSIPVIIHEQTLVSGLANTISSYFADKIAVSFENIHNFNEAKTIVTGNPLRREIFASLQYHDQDLKQAASLAKKAKLPLILITGGNQGSHIINENVFKILEELTSKAIVIHQTGDSKFNDFEKLVEKQKDLKYRQRYFVAKWIDGEDFGEILKETDLVISRAGINTLVELAYHSIPTLLIPIPYLYKNEQNVNAAFFEKIGLAKVLPQSELNHENLLKHIQGMLKNLPVLQKNAQGAKKIIAPDAAQRLALETLFVAKK